MGARWGIGGALRSPTTYNRQAHPGNTRLAGYDRRPRATRSCVVLGPAFPHTVPLDELCKDLHGESVTARCPVAVFDKDGK